MGSGIRRRVLRSAPAHPWKDRSHVDATPYHGLPGRPIRRGRALGMGREFVDRSCGVVRRGAGDSQAVAVRGPYRLAGRDPDAGRRDVPRGRRAGRAGARHSGHRRGGGLHRVRLQGGRAETGPRRRRLFPAVLAGRRPQAGRRPGTRLPRPVRSEDRCPLHRGLLPLAIGGGETLEAVPIVVRRVRDHGEGRLGETRLRRLCGDRRQGEGRPRPAPRAAG